MAHIWFRQDGSVKSFGQGDGSDCGLSEGEYVQIVADRDYGPKDLELLIEADPLSAEEQAAEAKQLSDRQAALDKLRAVGLTDDELATLGLV